MHPDFFVRDFRKNNDECILILVIYWKKTGLLCMKISNHNIIYSSQKPRKSSLPLKSSSQLFSFNASLIDVRVFMSLEINTYPWRIRRSSNLGHIFREKRCVLQARKYGNLTIHHEFRHLNVALQCTLLQFWIHQSRLYVPHTGRWFQKN
jgi:hypothetical protein